MTKTRRLRELLAGDQIVIGGGAHDAFSAKLVEQAGFELCVVTGAGVSLCRGYPDVGLISLEESVANARYIAEAVEIPVVVDADNGYGNAINVMRTVRAFEQAGVAGIHIEDQTWPKRCGHMFGKSVIPKQEMVQKIRAALDARRDADFLIVARCDALMVNGLEDTLERAEAYGAAGADLIWCETRESLDEVRAISERFNGRYPMWWNHSPSGMVPRIPADELHAMGFKTACFYVHALMAAAKTMRDVLAEIRRTGNAQTMWDQMLPFDELWDVVGLGHIRELEKKYGL